MSQADNEKEKLSMFLKKYSARNNSFLLAKATKDYSSLQEVWDKTGYYELLYFATCGSVLSCEELHEFALWSAEQVRHLMVDKRSLEALRVKRLWLDGLATNEELRKVRNMAWAAASDAKPAPSWHGKWAPCRSVAWNAAWAATASGHVATGNDYGHPDATCCAFGASDSVFEALGAAAADAMVQWLRENTKPSFN